MAGWRGVGSSNQKTKVSTKPVLSWVTAAAQDPDVVEIFNFGWYVQGKDGSSTRQGGHWVNVVGAGPGALQFDLHNSLLESARQKDESRVTLKMLGQSFVVSPAKGAKFNMNGYYEARGPGLPFSPKAVAAAVLDSVIVFKLKKEK